MRRLLMTGLGAAASIAIASPAAAAVSLSLTNGSPLSNQIFGVAGTDGIHVYGTAPSNGGPANVEYTGNTDLHITSGFAQIQDAGTRGEEPPRALLEHVADQQRHGVRPRRPVAAHGPPGAASGARPGMRRGASRRATARVRA